MAVEASPCGSAPVLAGLLKVAASDSKFRGLLRHVGDSVLHVSGVSQVRPWLVGVLAHRAPVLVITATGREAEDVAAELRAMLGDKVAWFPSWETLPHERMSPGVDTVGRRAEVLANLSNLRVVVMAARAFCQPVLDQPRDALLIRRGSEYDFAALTSELVFRGYAHVDMVAKRGEFATRGGIIDVFPTTAELPVRVEFWGDEASEIRPFSVADQRAIPDFELAEVAVYSCRELLVDQAVARRAGELAARHPGNPALVELLSKLAEGSPADGMEALIPALVDAPLVAVSELFPRDTHVLLFDPEKIRRRIADLQATDAEFLAAGWEAAAMGASGPLAAQGLDLSASSYRSFESLRVGVGGAGQAWWTVAPSGMLEADEADTLPLDFQPAPAPRGDSAKIESLMGLLLDHTRGGGRAAFIAPAAGAIKRMVERFAEQGIAARVAIPGWEPSPGEVTLYQAMSHAGLVFPKVRKHRDAAAGPLIVVTETDLTGNRGLSDSAR